jgi:hypothetical protein
MKVWDAKYDQIGANNANLTNKANSISVPRRAKPLIMSGQIRVKSFVSHKRTAHDERFGFERRRFRYRSSPKGILQTNIQNPTSNIGSCPSFNQQSQFSFRPLAGQNRSSERPISS